MSNAALKNEGRTLTRAGAPKNEDGSTVKPTTYLRLRPLKDSEKEKGNVAALNAGDKISGLYVKSFVDTLYGKTNFVILTENGEVVIPGSGNLNSRMTEVPAGAYTEITYKGKSEMKSGKWKGKSAHNFTVEYEQI